MEGEARGQGAHMCQRPQPHELLRAHAMATARSGGSGAPAREALTRAAVRGVDHGGTRDGAGGGDGGEGGGGKVHEAHGCGGQGRGGGEAVTQGRI